MNETNGAYLFFHSTCSWSTVMWSFKIGSNFVPSSIRSRKLLLSGVYNFLWKLNYWPHFMTAIPPYILVILQFGHRRFLFKNHWSSHTQLLYRKSPNIVSIKGYLDKLLIRFQSKQASSKLMINWNTLPNNTKQDSAMGTFACWNLWRWNGTAFPHF